MMAAEKSRFHLARLHDIQTQPAVLVTKLWEKKKYKALDQLGSVLYNFHRLLWYAVLVEFKDTQERLWGNGAGVFGT